MHRVLLTVVTLSALASSACETCEAPVNADMIVNVALGTGVSPTGMLFIAALDADGDVLALHLEGSAETIVFPHQVMWSGNCDEGQMPPGTYPVIAWLSEENTATPPPGAPQGSAEVQIIGTNENRRAAGEVFITID